MRHKQIGCNWLLLGHKKKRKRLIISFDIAKRVPDDIEQKIATGLFSCSLIADGPDVGDGD